MKLNHLLLVGTFISTTSIIAQNVTVSGNVKDASTGEAIIGAIISLEKSGTTTDIDGNYSVKLQSGTYKLIIDYPNYNKLTKTVVIKNNATLNFSLEPTQMTEVEVVADIAKERETPVAFSSVNPKKIQEELGSQDLPMVLNSTPGVYATQTGGGVGDARISIRGFNQANVAVMIDGIPVNDMENGAVYWSNWPGLDVVTRQIQVQRGLGASKIVIPAIGGTINYLTTGIEGKANTTIKQEFGNNAYSKTTIGFNTARNEKGWGATGAFSYLKTNGYVDQTWANQAFAYLKVEKMIGKHIISASAMGAPQVHAQRGFFQPIAMYDSNYARKNGMDTNFSAISPLNNANLLNKGREYNYHWGYLTRTREGETTPTALNTNQNFYTKPLFSLKDFWNINDKLSWSNIAYASIGDGGGQDFIGSYSASTAPRTADGLIDLQKIYNNNNIIDPVYSTTERKASSILRASMNNHRWFGLLSTFNIKPNNNWNIAFGIDARTYKGLHYRVVRDLLGGQYFKDDKDENQAKPLGFNDPNRVYAMKRVGDVIDYNNNGYVKWGGLFGQAEYKKDKVSTFVNISAALINYKRVDFFKKKDLVLSDTTFTQALDWNDTINYKGTKYTGNSEEARYSTSPNKKFYNYSFKAGLNYNLTEHINVFTNIGYISKAPRFNNVFDNNNKVILSAKNEIIKALELGSAYRNGGFALNLNAYYTLWDNKPKTLSVQDANGNPITVNLNGLNARHTGIELDYSWNITRNLNWEVAATYSDWIWTSGDTLRVRDEGGNIVPFVNGLGQTVSKQYISAKGVHIGDAAQTQLSTALKFDIKGFYIKPRLTFFGKNYADLDAFSLVGKNENRDSWKVPNYYTVDLNLGYGVNLKRYRLDIRANIINILDNEFISDARNGASFDANTATVMYGMGRRWNLSFALSF